MTLPGKRVPRLGQLGQPPGPFDHDRGNDVTQHRRLARPRRPVDGEQAAVGTGHSQHTVDGELLAERQRMIGAAGPTTQRHLGRRGRAEHDLDSLPDVHPGGRVDLGVRTQILSQHGADRSSCLFGHPAQVVRDHAVEEVVGLGAFTGLRHGRAADTDLRVREQTCDLGSHRCGVPARPQCPQVDLGPCRTAVRVAGVLRLDDERTEQSLEARRYAGSGAIGGQPRVHLGATPRRPSSLRRAG